MALAKRIGTILKEARESRGLSTQDVSRETNMIPRYVEALENEDYSVFPSETYAIGFLRSYAEYLNLDPEDVSSMYRGVQIDQAQAPVRELTRPIASWNPIQFLDTDLMRKILPVFGGVLLVGVIGYLIYTYWPQSTREPEIDLAAICDAREKTSMNLPAPGLLPVMETFTPEITGLMIVDSIGVQVCVKDIDPLHKKASMIFLVDGSRGVLKELQEGKAILLSEVLPILKNSSQEVSMTPGTIASQALSVELASRKVSPAGTTDPGTEAKKGDELIRVTLQFVADSYLEWRADGKKHGGVTISSGETRTFEANNRLEIKVGNGGGVRVIRDGNAPKLAGPSGSIVKISYRMAPDPLDPGMTRVIESLEVVR